MIVSNLKALEGLLWGTALGDSLARMHRFRKPPFLLHSATGTWFLAVFQKVFEKSDLATKLEVLTAPCRGLALRGGHQSLAHTLLETSTGRPSHKLIGDVLPCVTPLAFMPKEQIIEVVHVTHWHPRVISSAALLVGALRALLVDPKLSLQGQLEQGEILAEHVLHLLFEKKEADTPQAIWTAHQALKHHVALAKGALEPSDLQVPMGYDGRDSPEQLVVYALALSAQAGAGEKELQLTLEQGGTSDILAPLVGGLVGFHQGSGVFAQSWFDMMLGKDLWNRHLMALASRDCYFPGLAEVEIGLTHLEENALKELNHFPNLSGFKNQLSLFEDQVVKRELALK